MDILDIYLLHANDDHRNQTSICFLSAITLSKLKYLPYPNTLSVNSYFLGDSVESVHSAILFIMVDYLQTECSLTQIGLNICKGGYTYQAWSLT